MHGMLFMSVCEVYYDMPVSSQWRNKDTRLETICHCVRDVLDLNIIFDKSQGYMYYVCMCMFMCMCMY